MGMGISIPMGFPWGSHGNGSSFGLLVGIVLMGMGIAYFIGTVNTLQFLHSNMQ